MNYFHVESGLSHVKNPPSQLKDSGKKIRVSNCSLNRAAYFVTFHGCYSIQTLLQIARRIQIDIIETIKSYRTLWSGRRAGEVKAKLLICTSLECEGCKILLRVRAEQSSRRKKGYNFISTKFFKFSWFIWYGLVHCRCNNYYMPKNSLVS